VSFFPTGSDELCDCPVWGYPGCSLQPLWQNKCSTNLLGFKKRKKKVLTNRKNTNDIKYFMRGLAAEEEAASCCVGLRMY